MAWYDVFANFYDASLDGVYKEHRQQAAAALALEPGMTVVDVGCGTGLSFEVLVDGVGPTGRVLGVDASAGMLRKAEGRVRRQGWDNVELVEIAADDPTQSAQVLAQVGEVDRVLCFLSLSVIGGWEDVLRQWFGQLRPGGKLVIADVHNPSPGLYAKYVEFISRGTLTRRSWEPLEELSSHFTREEQDSSWVLGGTFFVATGTK